MNGGGVCVCVSEEDRELAITDMKRQRETERDRERQRETERQHEMWGKTEEMRADAETGVVLKKGTFRLYVRVYGVCV